MAAAEVLRIGDSQRQSARTGLSREKLRMADTSGIDRTDQMPFQFLLSYDVSKTHSFLSFHYGSH